MRKRALSLAFLLLFVLLVMSSNASASGIYTQADLTAKETLALKVRTLLRQEKFKQLEDMANEFRDQKSRFSEGVYKLYYFYEALSSPEDKSEQGYERLFRKMDKWSRQYHGSITERVAEAGAWLGYAWFARGTGYADTVSDEGWRLFGIRVKKAYKLLNTPPKSKSDDCPQRYTYLLTVGRAQGWDRDRYETVFKDAVAFNPTYYSSYFEKAYYLLPRWHGAEGEWQKFAEEAVSQMPESEGMTAYTRILWATWNNGTWSSFEEAGISWPKMKQGFLDIEKNFPGSAWNLNYFALFAFKAYDMDTARELFKLIGDKPYLEVWKTKDYYECCKNLAMGQEQ